MPEGVRHERMDLCVRRGVKSHYACLRGSVMWVALSRREARRVSPLRVKWARSVEAMGLVKEKGGYDGNRCRRHAWPGLDI
jgi:hypothetical protein